jgi:hypothetical protein
MGRAGRLPQPEEEVPERSSLDIINDHIRALGIIDRALASMPAEDAIKARDQLIEIERREIAAGQRRPEKLDNRIAFIESLGLIHLWENREK